MEKISSERKREKRIKLYKFTFIETLIGVIIFFLVLKYSQDYTFLGSMDALFVSGVLIFGIGWLIFVTDFGIFDLTIYGFISFTQGIRGKKPKKTIEEAIYDKERIPGYVYQSLWITGLLQVLVSVAIYVFYYL